MPSTQNVKNGDSASLTDVTVSGTLTGNVTGNLTGNVAGTLVGGHQDPTSVIAGDGAIPVAPGTIFLTKGSAAAITLAAPTATTHDGYEITVIAGSAQAHVITCSTVGFNAKGSSGTITFTAAIGNSVVLVAYQGNWYTKAARNVTVA
jgi:hypothetical protein